MPDNRKPIKARMAQGLYDDELESVKACFLQYLVDHDVNPEERSIDQPLVDGIIQMMAKTHPDWNHLQNAGYLWTDDAIEELRHTCRSMKEGRCKKLREQMAELRAKRPADKENAADSATDQDEDAGQIPSRPTISIGRKSTRKSN